MEQMKYWRKQNGKPLFADVDMERPEQRGLAGRLLLVGGSGAAFFAVAAAAGVAAELKVGEVRTLLPDSLKKKIPSGEGVIFAPSDGSGGFSKEAVRLAVAAASEADMAILLGDMGKNSETATFAERWLAETDLPVLITRDAVELLAASAGLWLSRGGVSLCAALPQLQKVLRAVYYPRMVTLSMPTNQLVETLHKFTISYPVIVTTFHEGQILTADRGEVVSTNLAETKYSPISLWSGELQVKMAALMAWNRGKDFAAAVDAVLMR